MKKVAEHDERLKSMNLEAILKKLHLLQDEMTKTKSDIMKLENDKAEKLFVENEFKKSKKEMELLNDWCARLEEMINSLQNNQNNQ